MSRVRIIIDSATPDEVLRATRAFQVSAQEHMLPNQLTDLPTVAVVGQGMTWTSPAMTVPHARAVACQLGR